MAKHWWHRLMDGSLDVGSPAMPKFVPELGITPRKWEPGYVELDWAPPAYTRTPGGWVQGGFLGVPLDMAQTFALITRLPEGSMPQTLEMKMSYLDGPFAERYVVVGRALRWGKRAGHTDGEIRDTEGKLIATSTSTHVIRQIPPEQRAQMKME